MKVSQQVDMFFKNLNQEDFKKLRTLQITCNSDSAFLSAVNKYAAHAKLLQKAFLLSRTWEKLGQSRTWKITIKALAAAFKALANSFKRLSDVFELPVVLQKQIKKLVGSKDFKMALAL